MARVILVDSDEIFLSNLEWYFVKQSKGEIELETISNREYLPTFFSTPRSADALVIARDMYFSELERHNIGHLFFLTEDEDAPENERADVTRIPKYETSLPAMYNIVTGILKQQEGDGSAILGSAETTVTLVYSPIGGAGASSIAAGICARLEKNFKHTLFLDASSLQTFGSFFSEEYKLECWQRDMFDPDRENAVEELRMMTRREVCDYLPPYSAPLFTVPVSGEDYVSLLEAIRHAKAYDYVVLTCGSEFSADVSRILSVADRVVLVYEQGESAAAKLDALLNNINYSDGNKFSFVCNRYTDTLPLCEGELKANAERYHILTLPYMAQFPRKLAEFDGVSGFQAIVDAIQ